MLSSRYLVECFIVPIIHTNKRNDNIYKSVTRSDKCVNGLPQYVLRTEVDTVKKKHKRHISVRDLQSVNFMRIGGNVTYNAIFIKVMKHRGKYLSNFNKIYISLHLYCVHIIINLNLGKNDT